MKSSYLRVSAALACAVLLSACGGDDGQLLLGGTISGVTNDELVLMRSTAGRIPASATARESTMTESICELISCTAGSVRSSAGMKMV